MWRFVLVLLLLVPAARAEEYNVPFRPAGPPPATIAFDAASEGTGTTSLTWTHTPVGTPKGVVVYCAANTSATDVFSGATYGGTAMTQVNSASEATEAGFIEAYFLGASIPTGAQTVVCTISSGSTDKHGAAVSVTVSSGANTQTAGADSCTGSSAGAANPSCTIGSITGASYGFVGLHSGQNAPSGVTAGTGETERHDHDYGTQTTSVQSQTAQQSSGDSVRDATATSEDYALVGVAIEVVP